MTPDHSAAISQLERAIEQVLVVLDSLETVLPRMVYRMARRMAAMILESARGCL